MICLHIARKQDVVLAERFACFAYLAGTGALSVDTFGCARCLRQNPPGTIGFTRFHVVGRGGGAAGLVGLALLGVFVTFAIRTALSARFLGQCSTGIAVLQCLIVDADRRLPLAGLYALPVGTSFGAGEFRPTLSIGFAGQQFGTVTLGLLWRAYACVDGVTAYRRCSADIGADCGHGAHTVEALKCTCTICGCTTHGAQLASAALRTLFTGVGRATELNHGDAHY